MSTVTLNGVSYDDADFSNYGFRTTITAGTGASLPRWQAMWVDGLTDLGKALTTTSATELTIGTGSKSLTLAAARPYAVGAYVTITSTADPANSMWGRVTAISGADMTVDVISTSGSGTADSWSVGVSGARGATGTSALAGTATGDIAMAGYDLDDVGRSYGRVTALTDGATITPDFAVGNLFSVTLGGNRTLANPSNLTAGQSGQITITQDGTGSRTLAYGSYWDFAGGTVPTLTTTANAVDVLVYTVVSSTKIAASLLKDVK